MGDGVEVGEDLESDEDTDGRDRGNFWFPGHRCGLRLYSSVRDRLSFKGLVTNRPLHW